MKGKGLEDGYACLWGVDLFIWGKVEMGRDGGPFRWSLDDGGELTW